MSFFVDFIKGFMHFTVQPLYNLFFNSPRLYEKYISFCVYIKNSVPTKEEIKHVWLIYLYRYNSVMLYISIWFARCFYEQITISHNRCKKILEKI